LMICSECSKWFESTAPRSPHRNAYCRRCGRAAALRAASSRYYAKTKSKKASAKKGKRRRKQ
jgi:hypothetical protein